MLGLVRGLRVLDFEPRRGREQRKGFATVLPWQTLRLHRDRKCVASARCCLKSKPTGHCACVGEVGRWLYTWIGLGGEGQFRMCHRILSVL